MYARAKLAIIFQSVLPDGLARGWQFCLGVFSLDLAMLLFRKTQYLIDRGAGILLTKEGCVENHTINGQAEDRFQIWKKAKGRDYSPSSSRAPVEGIQRHREERPLRALCPRSHSSRSINGRICMHALHIKQSVS